MEKSEYRILFVDDNPDILEANRSYFEEHGFETAACQSGAEAVALLRAETFACIVLDVSMPEMDGYEVCKKIRRQYNMPVIFLSCLDQPDDKVRGLMLGGDVYMTKPYDLRELHAQVLACLRRAGRVAVPYSGAVLLSAENSPVSARDFIIDRERRIIRLQEHCAVLSKKEMSLLLILLDQPGRTIQKESLCEALWPGERPDENRLQSLVRNLRRKVEFAAAPIGQIENVYGFGYRLRKEGNA